MKQTLLFFFFVLSISVYSQIEGPPPPCGYTVAYACDDDGDGFGSIDLTQAFPFETFCRQDKGSPEEYYPIQYYVTQEDMNNEINPIANPSAYTSSSNPETIFYRANKIIPDNIEYLTAENIIEVKRLSGSISPLTVCDDDGDGLATFDLTTANVFCGAVPINNSVEFYETEVDANAQTNRIIDESNYISEGKVLYVRVEDIDASYVELAQLYLNVHSFSIGTIGNILTCDDANKDGIVDFDLGSLDSSISNGQTEIEVYYYEGPDYTNQIDKNIPYRNVANPQTIYVRAENSYGCSAYGSFMLNVLLSPSVAQVPDLEVCDDDNDGRAVFDLSTIWDIINEGTIYDMPMFTTYEDALYGDGDSHIGFENDYYNYTNISNPQTIYVKVEDMDTGCFTITTLQLVVKDCSSLGVMEINAFIDENENSMFDNDEPNFLNGTLTYEKNNDGIQHVLHASNGIFNIINEDETNTYNINYNIYDDFLECYETIAFYENVSVEKGSRVNLNFPITKIKDCNDVAVYLTQVNPPRPGFDYSTNLVIINLGGTPVNSGSIEFIKDDLVTFKSVYALDSGNTITNTSSGFILNFNNLPSNGVEQVVVNMNVPVSVNLGDLLTSTATYISDDLDNSNNVSTLTETVIGSYDPNDIMESHGPEILYDDFSNEDYLYYTIRFQNVGTADAINVSIDNTLDVRLDKSTIQMLASSHDYVFTRVDNQLNWKFNNIQLPSEEMDEPNSHGYVYYKIKPLVGYNVGDIIPNTAEIYFDFNEAVVTNTFETEFVEDTTLSNAKFSSLNFSLYPNPTNNFVEIRFNNKFGDLFELTVYNIQGKEIMKTKRELQDKSLKVDVSTLKSGLYFIEAKYDLNKKATKKLIIN